MSRILNLWNHNFFFTKKSCFLLTDGIFENGAYARAHGVPSKSQIQPFWVKVPNAGSNPSWACRWLHPFGTNNYPPFRHSTKNQVFIPALDFFFFAKIRLEITNIWCGVSAVATCPNKNDGVKMAQRWCRGSKNSKYQKHCLGPRTY